MAKRIPTISLSPAQFAELVYVNLVDTPPEAKEQAEMLVEAFHNYLKKENRMDVQEIKQKYVSLTGAKADTQRVSIGAWIGFWGEVVFYDAVNSFFDEPAMQDRYGVEVIQGTRRVLVPADENKASQTGSFVDQMLSKYERQAQEVGFSEWRQTFGDDVGTVADFFMKDMIPMEAKGKLNSYVMVSPRFGKEGYKRKRPSSPHKISASNPHLKSVIKSEKAKIVVGGLWGDAIYHDVTKDIQEVVDLQQSYEELLKLETKVGKERDAVIKFYADGDDVLAFQLVSIRLETFIPMIVDKKHLSKILEKDLIYRSDMMAIKASAAFTTEMLLQLIDNYDATIL